VGDWKEKWFGRKKDPKKCGHCDKEGTSEAFEIHIYYADVNTGIYYYDYLCPPCHEYQTNYGKKQLKKVLKFFLFAVLPFIFFLLWNESS